jgi:hypothetical protein
MSEERLNGSLALPAANVDPRRIEGETTDPVLDVEDTLAIGEPRSKPAPNFRTILQDDVPYYLIRWSLPVAPLFTEKTYQITGDHVYCELLTGGNAVYIKLGPVSNPWIRLRQGMTYRRRFGTIRLVSPDEFGFEGVVPSAVLYVSTGPLIIGDKQKDGIDANILAAGPDRGDGGGPLLATTVAQSFLGPIYGAVYASLGQPSSAGANGGALVIKNTDLANTLYISGTGTAGNGFPLLPGETFQATIAGRLTGAGVTLVAPLVFTLAGTCAYAFILSPYEKDQYQDNAAASGGIN